MSYPYGDPPESNYKVYLSQRYQFAVRLNELKTSNEVLRKTRDELSNKLEELNKVADQLMNRDQEPSDIFKLKLYHCLQELTPIAKEIDKLASLDVLSD